MRNITLNQPNGVLRKSNGTFSTLRRFVLPGAEMEVERCEFCSAALNSNHRHLLQVSDRKIICTCDPCALRFQSVVGGRFQLIPREVRILSEFRMADAEWNDLALPINLAFFVNSVVSGKVIAVYPSPAGPVEAFLSRDSWNLLTTRNPVLDSLKPDVEALLINRVGAAREYFIAPIDACYELVGVIRQNWRGFSGGETVWDEIKRVFVRLAKQAAPVFSKELGYA